uniref:Uncharacterized protein n=1 Tax=Oryza rufipogon TaxID=4529 RepID=A0A0E0Q9L4_ORYRU
MEVFVAAPPCPSVFEHAAAEVAAPCRTGSADVAPAAARQWRWRSTSRRQLCCAESTQCRHRPLPRPLAALISEKIGSGYVVGYGAVSCRIRPMPPPLAATPARRSHLRKNRIYICGWLRGGCTTLVYIYTKS